MNWKLTTGTYYILIYYNYIFTDGINIRALASTPECRRAVNSGIGGIWKEKECIHVFERRKRAIGGKVYIVQDVVLKALPCTMDNDMNRSNLEVTV